MRWIMGLHAYVDGARATGAVRTVDVGRRGARGCRFWCGRVPEKARRTRRPRREIRNAWILNCGAGAPLAGANTYVRTYVLTQELPRAPAFKLRTTAK